MIRVVCSSIGNIIQHFFSIQAVPLCNREKTNRPESSLCVDVQTLAFSPTHVHWQLTCYGERMTQL